MKRAHSSAQSELIEYFEDIYGRYTPRAFSAHLSPNIAAMARLYDQFYEIIAPKKMLMTLDWYSGYHTFDVLSNRFKCNKETAQIRVRSVTSIFAEELHEVLFYI